MFACVALLSKESAMLLPLLILLGDLTVWEKVRTVRARILGLYVPLFLLALFLAWLVFWEMPLRLEGVLSFSQSFVPPSRILNRHDYLLTQSVSLLEYVKLLFVPSDLNVFHQIPSVHSFGDVRLWCGLAALVFLFWGAWASRRRCPWIAFSIAWFVLTLLPSSSFVPLQLPFDEDRLYLPLFGFALGLIGTGLWLLKEAERRGWLRLRRLLSWVPILMCILYLPHDFLRMRVWADELRLWRMNARDEPGDARAWVNLGNAWARRGRLPEATSAFREALALEPDYGAAHYFFGRALLDFQKPREARNELDLAFRLDTLPHDVLASLALASLAEQDSGRSARYFLWSLDLAPGQPTNLRNLGKLLADERQPDAAEDVLKRAVFSEPWNPENKIRLAYLLWNHDRLREPALDLLRSALRSSPEDERAKLLLKEIQGAP